MDSAFEFAKEVAPLFQHHNWLNLKDKPVGEAVDRIYWMTADLIEHVKEHAGAEPTFVSTGHVIVHHYPWEDEPHEIALDVTVRSMQQDEDGNYYDIYDERFDE